MASARPPSSFSRHAAPIAFALALFGSGCERQPSPDTLKEWTPTDHDRAEEQAAPPGRQAPPQAPQSPQSRQPQAGRTTAPEAPPSSGKRAEANDATLIEATWTNACAPCHGPSGHGDGPNGPMVNAPDITSPDLLSKISDDEIAFQIRNGKNRMPKFDLPDPVVRGLVARIRANRGR